MKDEQTIKLLRDYLVSKLVVENERLHRLDAGCLEYWEQACVVSGVKYSLVVLDTVLEDDRLQKTLDLTNKVLEDIRRG